MCSDSLKVRGWRSEVFRLCSENFGYYEDKKNSISYQEFALNCCVWFESVSNMRSFIEKLRTSHQSFCRHCPPLDLGDDIDFTMKRPPSDLIPILTLHYTPNDSTSPDCSNAIDYQSDMSHVSVVSVSKPHVFFRLVEDSQVFEDIKPCSCHIADAALYQAYDHDEENRLFLSQDLRSRFDGRQTSDSLPHVGIYFVSFDGREIVEYEGVPYELDRVTVAFEIPYPGVMELIKFKRGSFVVDGVMHTFLHVQSHVKLKHFLDLKYSSTMIKWDENRIQYHHHIYLNIEGIIEELDCLSISDDKAFVCQECGGKFKTKSGIAKHAASEKCMKAKVRRDKNC